MRVKEPGIVPVPPVSIALRVELANGNFVSDDALIGSRMRLHPVAANHEVLAELGRQRILQANSVMDTNPVDLWGCSHGSPPHVARNAVKELHIFNRPTEMLKPVRLREPKADQPRRAKSVANLLEVVRLLEGAVIARHPRIAERGLPVSTVKSSPRLECFELFRARILCVFHCFILRNHAFIVDNSLHFVKNFSCFVLKGLATYVYIIPL